MINELKVILQENLSRITGLSSGSAKPDDVIQDDEVYYGYEITYQTSNSTLDYEFNNYNITITGRLVSKNKTLAEMDAFAMSIAEVLKSLRFKYTIQDVQIENTIRKKIINGFASMDESTYFIR